MAAGEGGTVASLLWLVAFSALALTAVFSPANPAGVVGLVVAGHLLWGLAFALGRKSGTRSRPVVVDQRFVIGVFLFAGVVDLASFLVAGWAREPALAIWLTMALTFVAASVANTLRRPPNDGVFVCQVFFHCTTMLPAVAAMSMPELAPDGGRVLPLNLGASPLTGLMFLMVIALIPFLFTLLLMILIHEQARPRAEREFTWSALLTNQAAFLYMALRWMVSPTS